MVNLVETIYSQYRDNKGKGKGEIKMKGRKAIRLWIYVVVTGVAALIMAIIPSQALAQCPVNCNNSPSQTSDCDNDGISDYDECMGIYLNDGTSFPGFNNKTSDRNQYLDPNSLDLFVILVPTASTLIPADPLEFVYRSTASSGLGLATHTITASKATSDRYFGYRDPGKTVQIQQKAARVTESLDTGNTIILGISEYGTPNGLDESTVYTQRIKNNIMNVCGSRYGTGNCVDSAGVKDYLDQTGHWVYDLTNKYIKHTIAHEIGHLITLTTKNEPRFDGHHYKSGSQVILEQAVSYTDKSGKVTFYLSDKFALPADVAGIHLK